MTTLLPNNFNVYHRWININYLFMIYIFCAPISKAGTSIAGGFMILLWLLGGNFKCKYEVLKNSKLVVSIFLFITWSFIALLWSDNLEFAINYLQKYWHFLLIPIIVTSVDKRYMNNFFYVFILSMLIVSFITFGVFLNFWSWGNVDSDNTNPFMDHTNASVYIAFAIFLTLYFMQQDSVKKTVAYAALIILLLGLIVSGGRSGVLYFILTMMIIAWLKYKNLKIFAIIMVVMSIVFIVGYFQIDFFQNRINLVIVDIGNLLQGNFSGGGAGARVDFWITGIHVAMDNPIIGHGVGDDAATIFNHINQSLYFDLYNKSDGLYFDYHNAFIQYFAQLGLVGLVLFLNIFYRFFQLKFDNENLKYLSLSFLILFLCLSMGGLSMHIRGSMVLFVIFSTIFYLTSINTTRR